MRRVIPIVLAVLAFLPPVLADNIYPPPWRGEPRSTMQGWEFLTDNTNPPPDYIVNPYGVPSMSISDGTWFPESNGRSGVWSFVAGGIGVEIPNALGGTEKEVWLQLTYWDNGGLVVSVDGLLGTLVETDMLPDEWLHSTWSFDLGYNPTSEFLRIQGAQGGAAVDELVVDTICRGGEQQAVPEPATLMLLGVGVLAAMRRRRR